MRTSAVGRRKSYLSLPVVNVFLLSLRRWSGGWMGFEVLVVSLFRRRCLAGGEVGDP